MAELSKRVDTSVSSFNSLLSSSDTTVQAALDTIDNILARNLTWTGSHSFSNQITSTLAIGTSPFSITSTTVNTNLNADMVDGAHVGTLGAAIPLLNGNNTWSGINIWDSTSIFQEDVQIQDNEFFDIGDGSGQLGYMRSYMSSLDGYVRTDLSQIESLAGIMAWSIEGGSVSINQAGSQFTSYPALMVGPVSSGVNPAPTMMFFVGKLIGNGASGTTVSSLGMQYENTTNTSAQFNAVNQTARFNTSANLTSATLAGISGGRARLIMGTGATGTITLGSALSLNIAGAGSTTSIWTDVFGLYGEAHGVAGAQAIRTGHAFFKNLAAPTGSGSIGSLYGLRIEALTRGTRNYEVALEDGGGVWFRVPTSTTAATERIWSSAASTLDDNANTTRNFNIAGAVEATITANTLTFNNGSTDTFVDWATDATLKFGVSSTAEVTITATQIDLGSATTDLVNFIAGSGASAPSTAVAPAPPETYYGTGGTIFLSTPNAWLSIKSNGTTYKIPLYS